MIPTANKEDFIWHEVPRMKSHVALNPGTCPFFMHLPPLFVFHLAGLGKNHIIKQCIQKFIDFD